MSGWGIVIFLFIAVPVVAFAVWQFLQEAMVRIPSGSVGLLLVRGKATDRVLTPGAHIVWPFRQQMIQDYPLRDLTYLTSATGLADDDDFVDPPLLARLGDRSDVLIEYTIRFRIDPDGLRRIHDRVGPDGIKRLVRDVSRLVLVHELRQPDREMENTFGEARHELERQLGDRMRESLEKEGFELEMFHVRHVDLRGLAEVVEATVRAKFELALERAASEVRALRLQNEAASVDQLRASLDDDVLRYRQVELGREALSRWDGRFVIGDSLISHLPGGSIAAPDSAAAPVEEQSQ
jgi:regulator of protease activity HflC (stomatin/prohibitin superfamily)